MDKSDQMGIKDAFRMSFKEYESLPKKRKRELFINVQRKAWSWIQKELHERNAEWMIVCGGEVIDSSPTLDNFPSEEKLASVGREHSLVPYVFARNPIVEESAQSLLRRDRALQTGT